MHTVRKRLKLSPSKTTTRSPQTASTEHPAPLPVSHNALLSLLAPPEAGEEERGVQEEEEEYLLVEEDTTDSSLVITMEESQPEGRGRRSRGLRRKRRLTDEEEEDTGASESEEEAGVEVEIDRQLDQSLETKSKQHNLTTVNVRNILHEVITNEHVVAMMKAAINETEAPPPFEPKMTRSKFKEVVGKGGVMPAWNISPIKKTSEVKAPQFVDIPLAEEDSSDEEYRPDEEDEDETAEDTFQESDMESTASSPRGRNFRLEEESCSPWQSSRHRSRRVRASSVPMGPPPPPQAPPPRAVTDSSFLEKLHAVEEELAVLEPYQPVSEEVGGGVLAYRTRSKRPLRDVPLGRLEAELRAPDITPDMYDSGSAQEDREWTDWLRGLMSSDVENEEECDDDDDPEYNFLADIDEPDVEDYRDDKAVRITKKEVNQLMEELFETLKEDLAGQDLDDEGHDEEEEQQDETHNLRTHTTHTPDRLAEEEPITELRTVKQQLALIRRRQKLGLSTHTVCPEPFTLRLDTRQKLQLQQQLQQHVQLLTQVHVLSSPVTKLHSEADITRQFLFELDLLAQRGEVLGGLGFSSTFRASNLQGALQLLEELRQTPISYQLHKQQPDALGRLRCYPVIPAELAWLFATRPVFLYPELLPCASLDPALYCHRRPTAFTAAEDCLLVLGLRTLEGTSDPPRLVSQFILRKTLVQIRRRILQCCRPGFPDNIVKAYRYQRVVWSMPVACGWVEPGNQRPPVEREENILPLWLARSLPVIYPPIKLFNSPSGPAPKPIVTSLLSRPRRCHRTVLRSGQEYSFPAGTRYPPRLPHNLHLQRMGFVIIHPATAPPALSSCPPTAPPALSSCPPTAPPALSSCPPTAPPPLSSCPPTAPPALSSCPPTAPPPLSSCPPTAPPALSSCPPTAPPPLSSCPPTAPPPLSSCPPTAPPLSSSPPPAPAPCSSLSVSMEVTHVPEQVLHPEPRPHTQLSSSSSSSTEPSPKRCVKTHPNPDSPLEDAEDGSAPAATSLVTEQICRLYRTLAGLRKLQWLPRLQPPQGPASTQTGEKLPGPLPPRNTSSKPGNTSSKPGTQSRRRDGRRDVEGGGEDRPAPRTSSQLETLVQKGLVVIEEEEKEEQREEDEQEEGSDLEMPLLVLSESSPSWAGSVTPGEEEEEEEAWLRRRGGGRENKDDDGSMMMSSSDKSTLSIPECLEKVEKLSWLLSEGTEEEEHHDEDDEDSQREMEDLVFAQDYLHRVCEAVQGVPGRAQWFLEVMEEFEEVVEEVRQDRQTDRQASPVDVYNRLSRVLQPWPQLLKDLAAFLTETQAQHCGLLAEQRLFERSRQFLRRLGRSLGEGSSHYQEVVCVLQGGHVPGAADILKISSLLKDHTHLQQEFWEFFKELHAQPLPMTTYSESTDENSISQNPSNRSRKREVCCRSKQTKQSESRAAGREDEPGNRQDEEERREGGEEDVRGGEREEGSSVCAKNVSLTPTGEKLLLWTREADRAILTTCQRKGANQKTFHLISAQLGNKTAKQVSSRFQELMSLFRSASQKPTSCSEENQPISSQEAAPD
ncbi:uncharacterized protein gon4la [Polymixia lowei]